MLTVENLRTHCRTCLIKLGSNGDLTPFVLIANFPNIEKVMRVCLDTDGKQDELDEKIPNICHLCLNKWLEFSKHYLLAIRSDQTLRKFLEKILDPENLDNLDNENKFNQIFLTTETVNNICEIEKYETTSPFYQDSLSNTSNSYDQETCEGLSSACLLEESTQQQKDENTTKTCVNLNRSNSASPISENFQNDDVSEKSIKTFKKSKARRKKITNALCKIKRKYKTRNSLICSQENLCDTGQLSEKLSCGESSNKKVRFSCQPCKKYFYEQHKYDGHVKQIHEGIQRPYQCHICDKSYNSYKNLTHHIAENHSEKSQEIQKCKECNKTFKTSVTLRQHINNHHSNSNRHLQQQKEDSSSTTANNNSRELKRTICDQCGFMAAHQYSLVQHIKNKHTEAKEIKCEHCPKIFKSQYSLKYHMLSSHNPTNTKPFQCAECQMTFTRRTLLNLHKRTHLKYTERIKCDFEGCDVRFVKHGDKRHHMRLVHLKVKQHICDFCGEAFGAMQTLRHHRYIHTGEKPYKCNVCGQGFRQRTAMKTHCKTHYGKEEIVRSPEEINNLS